MSPSGILTLVLVADLLGSAVAVSAAPWGQVKGDGSWFLHRLWSSSGVKWPRTWMQVPVHSLQRLQDKAQRLAGMCEILVMGSIFSGQPMLTWAGHGEQCQASYPQPAPRSPNGGSLLKPGRRQTGQRRAPKFRVLHDYPKLTAGLSMLVYAHL